MKQETAQFIAETLRIHVRHDGEFTAGVEVQLARAKRIDVKREPPNIYTKLIGPCSRIHIDVKRASVLEVDAAALVYPVTLLVDGAAVYCEITHGIELQEVAQEIKLIGISSLMDSSMKYPAQLCAVRFMHVLAGCTIRIDWQVPATLPDVLI